MTEIEKPAAPVPTPVKPATPPENSAPLVSTPSQPITVAAELKAKGSATGAGPNTIVFEAPKGNGRRGANGILLKNDPAAAKSGSTWTFRWTRSQSAESVQMIHPLGRGHAIVHIDHRWIALSAAAAWRDVNWRGGDKKRVKQTNAFDKVFPLKDGEEYEVVSRLSPGGAHELFINGVLVSTGHVSSTEPLSLESAEKGASDFKGEGLPLKLMSGWAAVIIGPVDGGVNRASDLRYYPSVVNVGAAKR